jgi:hypothetical protein
MALMVRGQIRREPGFGFRAAASLTTLVATASLLIGCGGGQTQSPAPQDGSSADVAIQSTVAGATPASATPAPALDEILWAVTIDPSSDAPLTVTRRYPVDTTRLTASVLATNLPPSTAVDAAWSYNNTSLDAFATRVVVQDAAPRRWLSFHLDRNSETSWPAGTYAIEISLDGEPARRGEVEVGGEQ